MRILITYHLETIFRKKTFVNKTTRTIQVFRYGKKGENFLYQVLVLDLDFSDKENSMNNLIKKIALVFDELELEITLKNRIARVLNISSIKKRWEVAKMDILAENQGYELFIYCDSISEMLENEEDFIAFLHQNKMLGMIFNGNTASNSNFTFDNSGFSEGLLEEVTDNEFVKHTLLCLVSEKTKGHSPRN